MSTDEHVDTSTAVERYEPTAQELALPSDRELSTLWRMAKVYAQMPGLGKAYAGNPEAVMAAALTARSLDLPINPVVINSFYSVNGSLYPSTQILVALAARNGIELWFDDESGWEWATAYCKRANDTRVHSYTFTMENARKAGLTSKDTYQKSGDMMLRYRAASRLLRTVAPDVTLGLASTVLEGDPLEVRSYEELQASAVPIDVDDEVADVEIVDVCPVDGCDIDGDHRHDPVAAKRPLWNPNDERPFE